MRKLLTIGLAGAVMTTVLAACSFGGENAGGNAAECPWEPDDSVTATIRIGYQKIPNADVIVKDQRILENCLPTATIKWNNFASGGDVIQAFGGKSLDIGLAGSSPSTKALSEPLNLPVSVIWIHDVIGSAESLIVRDGAASDIAGLKGKTIATPFGSTAHYSLLQAINDAGEDPADYKLLNAEPEQIAPAWQRGDIDAAWVWDPALSELKADGGEIILTSEDTAVAGKPTFDLALADNTFIEENPEVLAVWAKAQDYAIKQIAEEPKKAAESVAVEVGVSTAEAEKLFAGFVFLSAKQQASDDYLGGKLGDDLLRTAKFLLTQDGIASVGAESLYVDGVDPTAAEAAAK